MKINQTIAAILEKAQDGQPINRNDALRLMQIDLLSPDMHLLTSVANQISRQRFENLGEVYAQIGLDFAPCPGNCGFCSFAANHHIVKTIVEYPLDELARMAKTCEDDGANGIYLMTTARYRFDKFLEAVRVVQSTVSPEMPLVANIADFDAEQAQQLSAAGIKAVYHAVRLNEGDQTSFSIDRRIRTIEATSQAGMRLHFCVEPVGMEHSIVEQVELMFLGRDLGATFSGAMRRVCVEGTRLAGHGTITWKSLARTIAVCRLVMGDTVLGHCTHEPNIPALFAGANLLWAEVGSNPRDDEPDTENNRGMSIQHCQNLLKEAGYEIRKGGAITALGRQEKPVMSG